MTMKKAAAIHYDPKEDAPRIVAKGRGIVADNIIEKALQTHVPIVADEKVAHILTQMELGDSIPDSLYEIVAEILIFVDDMDRLHNKIKEAEK